MSRIKTALISVYDKTGVVEFAKLLHRLNVEIISSGGTAALLKKNKVPVKEISKLTGSPEMLDGRVKTLHPKIHAGILAKGTKEHAAELKKHKIPQIDLVVVNLYPFKDTVSKTDNLQKIIEEIDIGGVALLRGAAKNFERVTVVCSTKQYEKVSQELISSNGVVSNKTRQELAIEAFSLTAGYDSLISNFFWEKFAKSMFPQNFTPTFEKVQDLRYGENYQQKAALYREPLRPEPSVAYGKILQGKEMSFNNFLDAEAAVECVKEFSNPAVSIVKHTNPCGVAEAKTISQAFLDALECDKKSAFGGIIALNRACDAQTAREITSFFNEVVIAPSFDKNALELFSKKPNLRLLEVQGLGTEPSRQAHDFKKIVGGLLAQERNLSVLSKNQLKFVTKKNPSSTELESMLFAWKVSKHVKSNAIVLAEGTKTIGLSGGQTSRIDAVKIAIEKAGARAKGAILASDGFFPFPDSIEFAAGAGISCIIQPGGSVKDNDLISMADKKNISMVFTGVRNFKH